MRILERYINNSIVTTFLTCVLIFCCLYVLIDVTSSLDEIIDRKVTVQILFNYYLSSLPIILVQTSPIACLISVLFTFSSLHNTNQVIAMRASGLSFWRIVRPALFFGLLISCAVFILNERFVPQATMTTKKIENENLALFSEVWSQQHELVRNLTFYGLKNRLYYIDTFNPETKELFGITIVEYDSDQNITQKFVAYKGVWAEIAWKFYQCQITTYEGGDTNKPLKVKTYPEKLMDIKETPEDFLRQKLDVNTMNSLELSDYIRRFSESGASRALNNMKIDLHQKIAQPLGNFVIVLVGLPFALLVRNRKGMTFTAIGMAMLIGFLYYVVSALSIAFGKGGVLPPILAAWSAPIIFTGIGIFTIENNF